MRYGFIFILLLLSSRNAALSQCSPGGNLNVPGAPDLYISSSACYTSLTMDNNGLLIVQSGVTLTINGNVNAANGDGITVQSGGNLIITGTITTNNNFSLQVSGTATIGNIDVFNNALFSITGTGNVTVSGNVQADNNCSVAVSLGGSFDVGGNVSVGGGTSSVSINGDFSIGGQYTGPTPTSSGGTGSMYDTDQIFLCTSTFTSGLVNGDLLWKGGTVGATNSWHEIGNWFKYNGSSFVANTAVPSSLTNVYISTESCYSNSVFPSTLTTNATAKSVTIKNNSSLTVATSKLTSGNITIDNGATLTVSTGQIETTGNWTNNGTYNSGTGNVSFKGTTTQIISGTSESVFYDFTVNNNHSGAYPSHVAVKLSQNATITHSLTLTDGILDVFDKTLTLGTSTSQVSITPTIGSADSYVASHHNLGHSGTLKQYTHASNVGNGTFYYFPIGDDGKWTPYTLKFNTGTNITTGAFITTHVNDALINGSANSAFISRVVRDWEVEPTGINTPNYDIQIYHNASSLESGGTSSISTIPFKKSGTTLYAPTNALGINTPDITEVGTFTANTADFTWSGLTSFSNFGGTLTNTELPVNLIEFTSTCLNEEIRLEWTTASEFNSSHFDLLHSNDGEIWNVITSIAASGTSTEIQNYEYRYKRPEFARNYYKLVQYDLNGEHLNFGIIETDCEKDDFSFLTYPNPSDNNFTILISGLNNSLHGNYNLEISDVSGRIISSKELQITDENNVYPMNEITLKPGLYSIKLTREGGIIYLTSHFVK